VLRPLATDLWVAEQPLRFLGLELGTRMTLVRLPGDRLWLHSPLARTPALAAEVERLGSLAWLVAPSRFHHVFVGEWQAGHPAARLLVAPGLETKRPDLRISGVLSDARPSDWAGTLDLAPLRGFPLSNEVVFFHEPSATLVASDLAFHVGADSPARTRLAFRLMGAYGRLACTPLERLAIRDRAAFRRSLERILAWPFSRVIVAHGTVLEAGGREALARAYDWVLRRGYPPAS
jgi:hypothetical protein